MTFADFLNNEPIQKAAEAFLAACGGRFVGGEPDGQLVYLTEDGTPHIPPDGATPETVLHDLQSGKPLTNLWPELEYDPEQDY